MTPDEIDAWVDPIKAEMKSFTLAELEQQGHQVLHRVMSQTTGKVFTLAVAARNPGAA